MAGNKKPQKKYKPKPVRVLPINMRFGTQAETNLQLVPHDCLAKFKAGQQEETDWHTIAARVNLGSVLAKDHFTDAEEYMKHALEALLTSYERFKSIGDH